MTSLAFDQQIDQRQCPDEHTEQQKSIGGDWQAEIDQQVDHKHKMPIYAQNVRPGTNARMLTPARSRAGGGARRRHRGPERDARRSILTPLLTVCARPRHVPVIFRHVPVTFRHVPVTSLVTNHCHVAVMFPPGLVHRF